MSESKRLFEKGFGVFDSNLTPDEADYILAKLQDERMDWFLNDSTVGDYSKDAEFKHKFKEESDTFQFIHNVYSDGEIHSMLFQDLGLIPMKAGIPFSEIFRIKANLLTPKVKGKKANHIHKDADENYYTILYYVNDADGDTILYDHDGNVHKITPKKGRMVIFDSELEHRSSSPTENYRMVINFIMKKM